MVMGDQNSPTFVTSQMLRAMKSGSVVFDMAASLRGGNVEQSRPNEVVRTTNGVTILGFTDLPSRAASLSSAAYSNNIAEFLLSVGHNSRFNKENVFYPSISDPVVRSMLVVDKGKEMNINVFKKPVLKILRNKLKSAISIETSKLAIPITRTNANKTISAITSTLNITLPNSVPIKTPTNVTNETNSFRFTSYFKSYFASKPSSSGSLNV